MKRWLTCASVGRTGVFGRRHEPCPPGHGHPFGCRAGRTKLLQEFEASVAKQCRVLAFDEPASFLAGRIEADLERAGMRIDASDVMIAATAIIERLPIVTGNATHFESVNGAGHELAIQNWRAP